MRTVQLELLRPGEILAERERCSIVYLPVGPLEWHMTGYALTVRGSGPAELEWVDQAGLAERSVPSAFARYYEEANDILKEN